MDWLEEELRRALTREEAPPGFEERLRRRLAGQASWPLRQWLAAAAAVMIAAGAGWGYRDYRGYVAKEQVKLAMKIAAVHVNHIQSEVRGELR
jgi:hypothetical protein